MKKLVPVILLPALLVAAVTIGLIWWERGAPPGFRPRLVEVTPAEVTAGHRGVRLVGTAHYRVRLVQKEKGGEDTWWVFPVLPAGDYQGRKVKVLVRTPKEPDSLLDFEEVATEGLASEPGNVIDPQVREALTGAGYELDPDLVLVEAFED